MKNNTTKYIFSVGILVFLIACSTKRDTFISRNSHALSTRDNILFNGNIALDKGIVEIKQKSDNFWEILQVERMQVTQENMKPGENRNANFQKAEEKAIKAIQKHSMYIQGSEKNPQMDEAHLLLGKARYYDQRFLPALEAFNYVLYKYPTSDKINEVKIWREKTNMRLDNDAMAAINLRKLLKDIKVKDQIFADANAAMAQAYLNLEQKDSAIISLQKAKEFTKSKEEISRYNFILGQLYEDKGDKATAFGHYQSIIDMKRKAGRQYVIHAHAKQAGQFDYKSGDTLAFLLKFKTLIEDRENRPYLDVLNHQLALYYDNKKSFSQAKKHYNSSLKKKTSDTYLIATNYKKLADIYFNAAKYTVAGKYYDSTMIHIKDRKREYASIKKKRDNLDDVIKYEAIAQRNDSILALYQMSGAEKEQFLKKLKQEEKAKAKQNNVAAVNSGNLPTTKTEIAPTYNNYIAQGNPSSFYFYNVTTVAYGRSEFAKIWGKRILQDNWNVSSLASKETVKETDEDADEPTAEVKPTDEKIVDKNEKGNVQTNQFSASQTMIDSISKERNFAYYQLGLIYKEKFKENKLAVNKLEQLLKNKPEERLVLPAMYNLYKLYEILDKSKAEAMKAQIIGQYPDSRYAQILSNPSGEIGRAIDSPDAAYDAIFKEFQKGETKTVLTSLEKAIERYNGEDIIPKFELLKAHVLSKLNGLEEYKKALNYVALNYPNSAEGKQAEKLITDNLPKLEALQLTKNDSKSWKMLFATNDFENKTTKILRDKIKKFITDRRFDKLFISLDVYTMTDNFVVVHGLDSEEMAKGIMEILKDYKDYKITETPIYITTENYGVIQIKKNFADYVTGVFLEPKATEATPEEPTLDENENEEEPTSDENENEEEPKVLPSTKKPNSDFEQLPGKIIQQNESPNGERKPRLQDGITPSQNNKIEFGTPPAPRPTRPTLNR